MDAFSIAVLVGGQSRRMGQNKSFVLLDGKPLIQHVLDQLIKLDAPIFLVTNTPDEYAAFNLPMVADIYSDHGALGGLYTAIKSAKTPLVLCAACDMPFIQPSLLKFMLESAKATDDAVLARLDDRWQIFPAVYRQSCYSVFEVALNRRELHIQRVVERVRLHSLTPDDLRPYDPDLRSFLNLNTPDDLAQVQR